MLFKIIRQPIIIIGMHRSGTSMLAQVLEEAGIFMGADFTAYHESNCFQRLNDELLVTSGGSWDNPVTTEQKPTLTPRRFVTEYTSFPRVPYNLLSLILQEKWGWKDPRNTFTIDSWLKIFPHLKVIHIMRNGIDAALSLYKRNIEMNIEHKWYSARLATPEACFDLWEQYVNEAQLWKAKLKEKYIEIRYEDLLNEVPGSISGLETFIDLKLSKKALAIIKKEEKNDHLHTEYSLLKNYAKQNATFTKLNYDAG